MAKAIFYTHYGCDPYYNMAFDEWMFQQALYNPQTVYLRLYTWNEGAVTFGFNQREDTALDFSKLGQTVVIRRITGGRALYHDPSELTYSIAVNMNDINSEFFNGSISDTSQNIAQILVNFLKMIGIESHYMRQSSSVNSNPMFFHKAACFKSHAQNEIVHDGDKIIASAQKRYNNILFQHGAIKINGVNNHPSVIFDESNVMNNNNIRLSLNEFENLKIAFKQSFEKELNISFKDEKLSKDDCRAIGLFLDCVKKNPKFKREITKQNLF